MLDQVDRQFSDVPGVDRELDGLPVVGHFDGADLRQVADEVRLDVGEVREEDPRIGSELPQRAGQLLRDLSELSSPDQGLELRSDEGDFHGLPGGSCLPV